MYTDEELAEAVTALDTVRHAWMARSGVVGMDVGFRRVDGKPTNELAIRVRVERKLKTSDVPPGELFPARVGRFPVQVLESRPAPEPLPAAADPPRQRDESH